MATIHVRLPGLLAQLLGGTKNLEIEAETLQGAIGELLAEYPALKVHLYEESGRLRPHVNLFHNDTNTRWLESLDLPVQDGDTITVMQAVSGG
jgi:molybdopterin converting factor small subunit